MAFEAAESFGVRVTFSNPTAIEWLAAAAATDLGASDDVYCCVEFVVTAVVHPHPMPFVNASVHLRHFYVWPATVVKILYRPSVVI